MKTQKPQPEMLYPIYAVCVTNFILLCIAIKCKNSLTTRFDVDCCKRDVRLAAAVSEWVARKTF